jgi:GT2 family glycosyltransferase
MFAIARECVGVATHCALVDVAVLKAVGGLSERFRSRWHDFDLANKLQTYGFHSIVTPLARIRWHGDADEPTGERAAFESRWWWWTLDDPYSRTETRTDRAWFIPRRDEVA